MHLSGQPIRNIITADSFIKTGRPDIDFAGLPVFFINGLAGEVRWIVFSYFICFFKERYIRFLNRCKLFRRYLYFF
jgi:hypothetical protein